MRLPKNRRQVTGTMVLRISAGARTALTLIELTFYVSLLSLVLLSLGSVAIVSTKAATEHDSITRLQERNRTALFRVTKDLRGALSTTVDVDPGKHEMSFTLALDFNGTSITPGDTITYFLEPRPDVSDGTGQLRRRNQTSGEDVTICSWIDLGTSGFEKVGDGVDVRISNVVDLNDGNPPLQVTRSAAVFPRN